MQETAIWVDVGVAAVPVLDDGVAVPEVSGVPVAVGVGWAAVRQYVEVPAAGVAYGTPAFLEVAAPDVAFRVERRAVGTDVMPAVGGLDRGYALVEAEGPDVAE